MSEAKTRNATTVMNTTMASASSFGSLACSDLCTGQTMAMMKSAQARGATTEAATLRAAKIATTAITPTIVRSQ